MMGIFSLISVSGLLVGVLNSLGLVREEYQDRFCTNDISITLWLIFKTDAMFFAQSISLTWVCPYSKVIAFKHSTSLVA